MDGSELDEKQLGDIQLTLAETEQNTPTMLSIAGHIRKAFEQNYSAKTRIESRMLDNIRDLKGEYDAETLAAIKEYGGSAQFIRITSIKAKAMIGWIKDVFLAPGERPFGIDPTPIADIRPEDEEKILEKMEGKYNQILMAAGGIKTPELDEELEEFAEMARMQAKIEIQEEANKKAKEKEKQINDILTEANFYTELSMFINDICTLQAGIMEGPVVEKKTVLDWQKQQDGRSKPVPIEKAVRKFYRISPFDVYPASGSLTPEQGDFIIKKRYTRSQLLKFKGVKGFNPKAIDLVLSQFGRSGYMEMLSQESQLAVIEDDQSRQQNDIGTIDCLKYWGSVQGSMLLEWGMSAQEIQDPFAEYEIIAYLIDNIVISATLNDHPLKTRGLFKATYSQDNEGFWGDAIPDVLRDIQKMANACVRAWVRNMGISSGPMAWINTDAIPSGTDMSQMYPWKVFEFTSEDLAASGGKPMDFFQPESNSSELMASYKFFFDQASEISGIPPYMSGSPNIGGAGDTASGLAMLMESASKTMKDVIGSIDANIIVPIVNETWLHIMLYEPDKADGDINIVPRASDYLIQKETLQQKRLNFLAATNNPVDMEIIQPQGRATILREVASGLKMQTNKIIPEEMDLNQRIQKNKDMQRAQLISETLQIPIEVIIAASEGQTIHSPQKQISQ